MKKIFIFDDQGCFAKQDWIGDREDLPLNATTIEPPSQASIWSDGQWIFNQDIAAKLSITQLMASKERKIKHLNSAAQSYIDNAAEIKKVPEFEVHTWSIQALEAKMWALDKDAPTPVLDQIATSRGIALEKLKESALRKTLEYEKLTAHIAGQRQSLQSKIEAAKTQKELDSIIVEFTAP